MQTQHSVSFEFEQPLANINVGNSLLVMNENLLPLKAGHTFVIEHVETTLDLAEPQEPRIVVTVIYVKEGNRAEFAIEGSKRRDDLRPIVRST
jgi:hypothetical protein